MISAKNTGHFSVNSALRTLMRVRVQGMIKRSFSSDSDLDRFRFFLRDVICCLFHVDGNSIVFRYGTNLGVQGLLGRGCETGTRLGYGAFRGRNAAILFLCYYWGVLGSKRRDFISTSTPMELLMEGCG
jgi:hypothetical protein